MRVCAHCGTEVDADALFCPTCGQSLQGSTEPELPPAPDWPEIPDRPLTGAATEPGADEGQMGAPAAEVPAEVDEDAAAGAATAYDAEAAPETPETPETPEAPETPAAEAGEAEPPPFLGVEPDEAPPATATHGWEGPVSAQPVPPWRRGAAHRAAEEQVMEAPQPEAAAEPPPGPAGVPPGSPGPARSTGSAGPRPGSAASAGIVRLPELLSDWLAGIGAFTAVLAMFLPWDVGRAYTNGWGLASGVNLVMTVALLGVLAIVFFSHLIPAVPERGLVLFGIGLVGMGIGLDRLSLPLTGAGGIVFLIAMIVLAVGGVIAVLGHDRTVGGPQA